jgi:DNA-binding MarR family transcriptional regulator
LTIEPSDDGRAVSVNGHSLYDALAGANAGSTPIEERRDLATSQSEFTRVVDRMEEASWPAVTRPESPPSERKVLCKPSPSVTATLVWLGCS